MTGHHTTVMAISRTPNDQPSAVRNAGSISIPETANARLRASEKVMTEVLEIQLRPGTRRNAIGAPLTTQAWLGNEMLCEHRTPICAAARVLVDRGMAQELVRVRAISGVLAFPATPIAKWARTTVLEGPQEGPLLRRFEPFTGMRGEPSRQPEPKSLQPDDANAALV